jgi:hypothetical protein
MTPYLTTSVSAIEDTSVNANCAQYKLRFIGPNDLPVPSPIRTEQLKVYHTV